MIAFQHVICDLMSASVQIIIAIPITYAAYNIYDSTRFIQVIGFFDTLGFYGVVHFAFLMTINRVVRSFQFYPILTIRLIHPILTICPTSPIRRSVQSVLFVRSFKSVQSIDMIRPIRPVCPVRSIFAIHLTLEIIPSVRKIFKNF
uniref:G protein-coupled receptor n=1 Tax=Acrobeloides nanus TaxID=290746 RepID=A0A914CGY4_9BILA